MRTGVRLGVGMRPCAHVAPRRIAELPSLNAHLVVAALWSVAGASEATFHAPEYATGEQERLRPRTRPEGHASPVGTRRRTHAARGPRVAQLCSTQRDSGGSGGPGARCAA